MGGIAPQMNNFFQNFSLIFGAGACGGLIMALVAWGRLLGHLVFPAPARLLLGERGVIQPGPDADPVGDRLPEHGEGHVGPGIGLYDAGSGHLFRGDLGSGHGVLVEIFPGGFRKPGDFFVKDVFNFLAVAPGPLAHP